MEGNSFSNGPSASNGPAAASDLMNVLHPEFCSCFWCLDGHGR